MVLRHETTHTERWRGAPGAGGSVALGLRRSAKSPGSDQAACWPGPEPTASGSAPFRSPVRPARPDATVAIAAGPWGPSHARTGAGTGGLRGRLRFGAAGLRN